MFFTKVNPVYIAILTGNLTMLMSGATFSWTSSELLKLQNSTTSPLKSGLTTLQSSWISSLVPLGAVIGPFLFGFLADRIGRRLSLYLLGFPVLAAYIIMALASIVELFYVSRFVIGLCVGGIFTIVPNYIGELADKSNRGIMGASMSCFVTAGLLLSYALGPYLSVMVFNLILATIPAAFLGLFFFVGIESPTYYISKGNTESARAVLQKIRGDKNLGIDKELGEIQEKIEEQQKGKLIDMFRSKGMIKAFVTAMGLITFQQVSGINFVFYYGQQIFIETGSSLPPEICSIIIGSVQFLSSFTTPFVTDRYGRKITLTLSAVGIVISEVPLGTYIYLQNQGNNLSSISFIPILCLTFFILFYNFGCGSLPWAMLGELFPTTQKVVASSVVTSFNWILAFLFTKYFDFFLNTLGLAWSFWIFAICCAIAAVLCQLFVIETKGKTLEEIQNELNK